MTKRLSDRQIKRMEAREKTRAYMLSEIQIILRKLTNWQHNQLMRMVKGNVRNITADHVNTVMNAK